MGKLANVLLGLLGLAFLSLWAPSPARACSCAGGLAHMVWPNEGADVPLDPVLVVETVGLSVHLWAQAGDAEVPLEPVRLLYGVNCFDVQFLRPIEPLVAGQVYELSAGEAERDSQRIVGHFTALDRADDAQLEELPLRYYQTLPPDDCGAYPSVPCEGQAELFVGNHELRSQAFGWMILRLGELTETFMFGGDEYPSYYLALPQGEPDACLEYELVDRQGVTRKAESLCKPARCARIGRTNSVGSCSHFIEAWGAAVWDEVEDGSCEASDAGVEPGADAALAGDEARDVTAANQTEHVSVATCAVTPRPVRSLPLQWLFLMMLPFARLLRTRVRAARTHA